MATHTINEGSLATPAALGTARSGGHGILTYADAIDLGVNFLLGHGNEASQEAVRHAVQSAYLDIINGYNWSSLEKPGRIHLHAAQATGTVTYTHATRTLTLAGATWPSWVTDATLKLNDTLCEVETYVDTTNIILDATLNPGADLAAGTTYSLFCRYYPLPSDFVNFTGPMGRNSWAYGQQIGMAEMTAYQRNYSSTGPIQYYAIGERPNRPAEKAIYPWPFAPASEPLDFTYQRRPRELQYTGRDDADMKGTITVTTASTAVVGSGTAFETDMAGAMLLIGRDGTNVPTGRFGLYRYAEQHRIHSVTTTLAMALASNVTTGATGRKYVVTDPIDIETCAQNAFLRYMEMHLALNRNICDAKGNSLGNQFINVAEKAMREAMAASYPTRYDPSQGRFDQGWPHSNEMATSLWGV
jgi:hypothetical protein